MVVTRETWLIHICDMIHPCVCDMTHYYVCHDSSIRVPELTYMLRIHRLLEFSLPPVTRRIHMCDTTRSCVRHDSFICVTCLIHVRCTDPRNFCWNSAHTATHTATHCNTRSNTYCNTLQHTLQHILQHTATHAATHMQCIDSTHFCRHLRTDESCRTYEWVISCIWMGHVTHVKEWWHPY